MGTQLISPKRGHSPRIFRPCLLWPNGWIDQDATWYYGRSWPGQHSVSCGHGSIRKGHSPQILAHVCCNQVAGWIKMPLGTKVGLSPGHILLHGDPASPPKRGTAPQFSAHVYCGKMDAHLSYCWALVLYICNALKLFSSALIAF